MTAPGPADSEIDSRLKGQNPGDGSFETYQATHARARNLWGTCDQNAPFQTDFGKGPVAVTIATYDQETSTNEVTAWRHVDPNGEVVNQMKVMMALWYWLQDGSPTNLGPIGNTTNRVPLYKQLAQQLRNWPTSYPGAMPGEPQSTYAAPNGVALERLGSSNVSSEPLRDPRTHPPVTVAGNGIPKHGKQAWPDGEFYELTDEGPESQPLPSRHVPNAPEKPWEGSGHTPGQHDPAMAHMWKGAPGPADPPGGYVDLVDDVRISAPKAMSDRELLFYIARKLTELGILQ